MSYALTHWHNLVMTVMHINGAVTNTSIK